MKRIIATGLASLGLIGGAGAVAYSHSGTPTVTINDHGKKSRVTLAMDSGQSFSCPAGTHDKLSPHDLAAGRIKLTLEGVRKSERTLQNRYPHGAPTAAVARYKRLHDRDNRLVDAYNAEVDQRNAIISSDCSAS